MIQSVLLDGELDIIQTETRKPLNLNINRR